MILTTRDFNSYMNKLLEANLLINNDHIYYYISLFKIHFNNFPKVYYFILESSLHSN